MTACQSLLGRKLSPEAHIKEVETRGVDVNENLAGFRRRVRCIICEFYLGWVGILFDDKRAHCCKRGWGKWWYSREPR